MRTGTRSRRLASPTGRWSTLRSFVRPAQRHPALKTRTPRPLRGKSAQRCQPRQPPRSVSPCGSCREARPGGHRVSAGRRWVTFMTRGAKSSLSRWRCAESVVTLSLGIQPCPWARLPARCSGSYSRRIQKYAAESAVGVWAVLRGTAPSTGLSYFVSITCKSKTILCTTIPCRSAGCFFPVFAV